MNVALYGPRGPLWSPGWAMTERGAGTLTREASTLAIGPSSLSWEDDTLIIRLDESTTPVPSPLRGVVRLRPEALVAQTFAIGGVGRHVWRPIAPRAAVEVELEQPGVSWKGAGYFDTNGGDQPLERSFSTWTWSRAHRARDTLIFYDVEPERSGMGVELALRIGRDGTVEEIAPPPFQALPTTFWRMPRRVRAEPGSLLSVRATLEDAPFYTRTSLDGAYGGEPAEIVHESLSASRLRSPIVKRMLPYRMPRRIG